MRNCIFTKISTHSHLTHQLYFAKFVIHCAALETESFSSLAFFLCIFTFPSLTLGLMLYFWLVVRSAYMDLRETGPVLQVFVDEDTKIEKAGGKYIKM